jgi:hypothetical protein
VSYLRTEVLMSLIIVTVKVRTVTVTSPLVHVNNCDSVVLVTSDSEISTEEEESSEPENSDD